MHHCAAVGRPAAFEYRYLAFVLGLLLFVVVALIGRSATPAGDAGGGSVLHPPAHSTFGGVAVPIVTRASAGLEAAPPPLGMALEAVTFAAAVAVLYETLRLLSAGVVWSTCVATATAIATVVPSTTALDAELLAGAFVLVGLRTSIDPQAQRWQMALGASALVLATSIDPWFAGFMVLIPVLAARGGRLRALLPALGVTLLGAAALGYVGLGDAGGSARVVARTAPALAASVGLHGASLVELLARIQGVFVAMPLLVLSAGALIAGSQVARSYRRELLSLALGCCVYVACASSSGETLHDAGDLPWYAGLDFVALLPLAFIDSTIARSAVVRALFVVAATLSAASACASLAGAPLLRAAGPAYVRDLWLLACGQHFTNDATCIAAMVVTATLLSILLTYLPRAGMTDDRRTAWAPAMSPRRY